MNKWLDFLEDLIDYNSQKFPAVLKLIIQQTCDCRCSTSGYRQVHAVESGCIKRRNQKPVSLVQSKLRS